VNSVRFVIAAAVCALLLPVPTLAVAGHGPVWSADYVAALQPQFGAKTTPYTGDLKLNFKNGIVTGTYSSISTRPDPYYGRIIQVSGGTSNGGINLRIGSISLPNGKIAKDGTISGTANWNGKLYDFLAKARPAPKPSPH
jgi:hypothetical protein